MRAGARTQFGMHAAPWKCGVERVHRGLRDCCVLQAALFSGRAGCFTCTNSVLTLAVMLQRSHLRPKILAFCELAWLDQAPLKQLHHSADLTLLCGCRGVTCARRSLRSASRPGWTSCWTAGASTPWRAPALSSWRPGWSYWWTPAELRQRPGLAWEAAWMLLSACPLSGGSGLGSSMDAAPGRSGAGRVELVVQYSSRADMQLLGVCGGVACRACMWWSCEVEL